MWGEEPSTEFVYPSRYFGLVGGALIGTAGVCLAIFLLLFDRHRVGLWVLAGFCLFAAPAWMFDEARNLRARLPLMRFDHQGFECLAGRVFWRDVEAVTVAYRREHDSGTTHLEPWFRLGMKPGTEIAPSGDRYAKGFSGRQPELGDEALEVPLWAKKQVALDTLRRFYSGPIDVGNPESWRKSHETAT